MSERVALFLPTLAAGGVERTFVSLAGGLSARGLEVDLVAANGNGVFRGHVNPQVRLVDLGAARVAAALPRLAAYLRREKPKALISGQTHANLIAVWARMLAGSPARLVLSEHHALLSLNERGLNRREGIIRPLLPLFYPRADALVGVSSGVADDLAAAAGVERSRVRVIHSPIVTEEMLAMALEEPRHPWLRDGGAPVVLSAGRLAAAKDFETLLRAFALARAALPCRLVILGEGPERARLESLAAELGISAVVSLPGFDPNPYAAMRCTSVYGCSSRREGLPTAIVEALACGAPVVATDCPHGPSEILDGGKYGRLTPVGDARALADALSETLRQPPDPAPGLRRAADFSLDRTVDQYLALLEQLR